MNFRRILSVIIAAALAIGCCPIMTSAQAASVEPIINVTFDQGGDSYTLSGNASLAQGRDGNALSLTGADGGYASINAGAKMKTLTGDFTISVWLKPNSTSVWARVFDLGTGMDVYTFLTVSAGAYPRFAIKNGGEMSMDSDTSFSVGEWHNASISRSGNTTTMYIDGFKVGSSTGITYNFSDLATFTQCYLGKSQWPDPYFDGMIDDFKVYSSALSENEIRELAAEAYTAKLYEQVYDKNCFVSDTHFYDTNGNELYAYGGKAMTITSTLENDTLQTGSLSMSAYAVDSSDNETLLGTSNTVTLSSLSSETVSFNIPASNAEKIVVNLNVDDKSYPATTLYGGIKAPVASPADSAATTFGAHDPSIVKFDGDDTYYVYSSHHLIFTSTDLINWTKYDFTNINASQISPVTNAFISNNYTNTTMNGTYWAPDVIYVPNDDHPYWMYISLSCGLGGRNSAISLMKSDSPLFWADPNADIEDAGVVFATKETSGYKTNAIDANIYVDSNDGKAYFIWGSFWGGIQAAPLTDDGFVQGIDYTSDSTILNTCKNNFGTTVFSQKNGVAGPEGAWMYENGNYRYMFTSYGWLGSNYNTRIARSALSQSFGTNMGTQLVDAKNVVVGTQFDKGSTSSPSGYKLIGSYRLGDGSMTVTNENAEDYYVPYESGDAHIYYGSGHNSAITAANGESFYCSHFRKDAVEGAAFLQVRKMMYINGWPVVSSVSYAGEVEQALPREMLVGTYDLASVGKTKMDGSSIATSGTYINRNYDLPVLSSKVTLNADGTMADGLGTWDFNGDHTITLRFAKNGNTSLDEYYKSGDVMTMYALYGYDKDEKQPCIALTGIDQNYVTQFGKKIVSSVYSSPAMTADETEPVALGRGGAGNPVLGFDGSGNILYGGDPAATVIGDTVYLIVGHDTASSEEYVMREWVLYTSKDMENWEYKGPIMSATDISWRTGDTSAWAGQMVEYNNKYYFYYCTWDKTSSGKQSIGVAVADNPEGPYTDPLSAPLVAGTLTAPESSAWNDIDPTVLIDTDEYGEEHRYLAWGNSKYYICELNEDMISIKDLDGDGNISMNRDIKERTIKSMNGGSYTEAPWLYKRDGKYYLFYAMNWREEMAYAMCDSPMGRYDFKQIIMPPTATSNTNHPSVIDFNGKTYFIYHNGALPFGSGFRRSVCIEELEFDKDGYVYPLTETSIGLTGSAKVIKTSDDKYIGHSEFENSLLDASYPISVSLSAISAENGYNTAWQLTAPKSVPDGENSDYYVSIQSVNKPGLYISCEGTSVALTQDSTGTYGDKMTFKTMKGLDGEDDTVSFQSVSDPEKYLTVSGNTVRMSYGTNAAESSFIIDAATEKDTSSISIAEQDPEEDADTDIASNFDDAPVGRFMYIQTTDQPVNTTYPGADLYIGTRGNGDDSTSNWWIEAGSGVNGTNTLVLNSGKFVSANRGPRMQITNPAMPSGYIFTGSFMVKLGSSTAQLFYGDSTTTQATNSLTNKLSTSEWKKVKVTIENDNDTFTRTMYVDDELIFTDYNNSFPVFWGTATNGLYCKVYFDDFAVTTKIMSVPTSISYSNGRVYIKGTSALGDDTVLIEAVYGADNVLRKAHIYDGVRTGSSIDVDTEFDSSDKVKFMLWDGNMSPLINCIGAQ